MAPLLGSFISLLAQAAATPAPGASPAPTGGPAAFTGLLPFLFLGVIFYFLGIRPQQKRQREARELAASVKPGDEIVTTGGILGRVHSIKEKTFLLTVAEGRLEMDKSVIGQVVRRRDEPAAAPVAKAK